MNEEELKQIISIGYEQNGIEFKPAFNYSDKFMLAKVTRAIIAMANRRDGGKVILGIEESNNKLKITGISDDEIHSLNYDDLSNKINSYSDPNINFKIENVIYEGKHLLIIHVEEFSDIPIICKKDFNNILRSGACYVRSKKKPESNEIPSQTEMRELLDLAKVKALRKYVTEATRANIELSLEENGKDVVTQYLHQENRSIELIREKNMGKILNKIKKRGFWKIQFFPSIFEELKIKNILDLKDIILSCKTDIRGWPIPYIDGNTSIHVDHNWIGQANEWEHHLEFWQLFQSGNLILFRGFPIDWRDQSKIWPKDDEWNIGEKIGVGEIIASFLEIYELFSRLSLSDVGSEFINVSISINNIYQRYLYMDTQLITWPLINIYKSEIENKKFQRTLSREELIANATNLATEDCIKLFSRFNFRTNEEYINYFKDYIYKNKLN